MKKAKINRRQVVKSLSLGLGAVGFSAMGSARDLAFSTDIDDLANHTSLNSKIRHSACRWCYQDIPLQEFASKGKEIGLKAIDLLKPDEWKIVQDLGLDCSLATDTFASITEGFNNQKNHEELQKQYIELITKAANHGIKQVIVFSGNRNGISDESGWEQCANGLDPIIKHAEKHEVTIVMELLNSKVDHKDYQCDRTPWGVALVDKIGSSNFKLLYDIYHMQIMEGDIIATIKKYCDYIAHYHTGGVPGRNEINKTQELNYPAIMKAIVTTGFTGYVAQEFIPTYDQKLTALEEAIKICNV